MKKFKYILLILLISFICITKANAECPDGMNISVNFGEKLGTFKDVNYNIWKYKVTINGKTYDAYCQNPSLDPGVGNNFQCLKELKTGDDKTENSYDAGIIKILNWGSDDLVRASALRTYQYMFGEDYRNEEKDKKAYQEYLDLANQVYNYSDAFKNEINNLASLTNLTVSDDIQNPTKSFGGMIGADGVEKKMIADTIVNSVYMGIVDAKKYAYNYTETKSPSKKVTVTKLSSDKSSKTAKIRVTLSNFNGKPVTLKNCKTNNPNITCSFDGKKTLDLTKDGYNDVPIKFIGVDNNNCKISYSFDYEYDKDNNNNNNDKDNNNNNGDNNQGSGGSSSEQRCFEITAKGCKNCQNFWTCIDGDTLNNSENKNDNSNDDNNNSSNNDNESKDKNKFSETVNYDVNFCEDGPKDEPKDEKCTTYMNPITCSTDPKKSEMKILEGVIGANACTVSLLKTNVKKCIIGQKDVAGNNYDSTNKIDGLKNNSFCKVYCNEEYDIDFPISQVVTSGRYFSVNAKVIGSKYCYLAGTKNDSGTISDDKGLDENYLKSKLDEARSTMIEKYAKYNQWKEASEQFSDSKIRQTENKTTTKSACENDESCTQGEWYDTDEIDYRCHGVTKYDEEGNYMGTCDESERDQTIYIRKYCSDGCKGQKYTCTGETKTFVYNWNYGTYDLSGKIDTEKGTITRKYTDKCSIDSSGNISHTIKCRDVENNKSTEVSNSDECRNSIETYLNTKWNDNTRKEAVNAISQADKQYKDYIGQYNTCAGGISQSSSRPELQEAIDKTWGITYTLNPQVRFWYGEEYFMNAIQDGTDKKVSLTSSGKKTGSATANSAARKVNEYYETEESARVKNDIASYDSFLCYVENNDFKCGIVRTYYSKVKYLKAQVTGLTVDFEPQTMFASIYPTGTIIKINGTVPPGINAEAIDKAFPVGFGSKTGTHIYTVDLKNLGEYYDRTSNDTGRIWGGDKNVVDTLLSTNSVCYNGTDLLKDGSKYTKNSNDKHSVYKCTYRVNCPSCPPECDESICYLDDCPTCPVTCDNCYYTNNNINVSFRPISSSSIKPSDRTLGANWRFDNINTSMGIKAAVTTKEIEMNGEEIFDITEDKKLDENGAWVFELTPDMANYINNNINKNGTYTDNTLSCYDYKDNNNTYKNVFCYSEVLNDLIASKYEKNIKYPSSRPKNKDAQKNYDINKGYWTTWGMLKPKNEWNINTNRILESRFEYRCINDSNKSDCIGPAWK